MEVSVVIPCYNSDAYIEDTVKSLLNQILLPKEIIIIDDNSNDNTLKIINKLKDLNKGLIKVISFDCNKGVSYARNYGVKIAKYQYILFLDSDDLVEENLLLEYCRNLDFDNDVLCYSAHIQIDSFGKKIGKTIDGLTMSDNDALGYEFVRNRILPSGVLLKKHVFEKCTGFDVNLRYCEDWDLWIRMAMYGGFSYCGETLVLIRRHLNNSSSNINIMLENEKKILGKYNINFIKDAILKRDLPQIQNIIDYISVLLKLELIKESKYLLEEILRENINDRLLYYMGVISLKEQNYEKALQYFKESLAIEEFNSAALNNIGAIYLIKGEADEAIMYFIRALENKPMYIDATINKKMIDENKISIKDIKFTWRELRETLTIYI